MTEPQVNRKEKFEIGFPAERAQDWSTLAHIIFTKKPALSQKLEEEFGVTFEKPTSTNPVSAPIKQITFWGYADSGEKIMKVLNVLMSDFVDRKYFSKEAVANMAHQINQTGFVSREFQKAAGNDNKNGGFAAKNEAQTQLAKLIDDNDLVFATGPAGTGKTHIAVVKAVQALKAKKISKILIARPATESGEKLGFLPGSQEDKLAPYMRPIYDEFDKAFGPGKYKQMMEEGKLEVVPVGFMRGRTFSDAFVILDEAQNTTIEQIKMALTRIGENTKMVVTGDPAQIDLAKKEDSGLMYAVKRLQGIEGVGVQTFTQGEVVRSKIVKAIVDALTSENPQKQAAPQPPR